MMSDPTRRLLLVLVLLAGALAFYFLGESLLGLDTAEAPVAPTATP